jgi:hypothetical protein
MKEVIGGEPDKWQAELLKSMPNRTLLLCSRQAGKSTVSSILALHKAVFYPDSLVLIVSKALRQAEELFRKIKKGLASIPGLCRIIRDNNTMVEMANGSRIVSLPGKSESIRAYSSVSLLVIDEAAQVPDDVYGAVKPMLAVSKGSMIALSTPYGKRGWFYNAWAGQDQDWKRIRITADDCSRISPEFLLREKLELGEWWVKQEYYCEFVDSDDQLFEHDLVMAAISNEVEAW